MCGGHSLHGKDWLKLAGGAALAATGLGAFGVGPLAGLLGGATTAGGAATTAGMGAAEAATTAGAAVPVAGDAFMPAALATDVAGANGLAAVPGAVAGDAYMPAALEADVAGKTGLPGLAWNVQSKAGPLLGKLAKAQAAYKLGSGLLGGSQPQGGGGGGMPPSAAFGQRASPVNLSQFMSQPNSMMQQKPQLPPQLAMLPPNDPRVLAYLQQMGGMYG